MTDRNGNEVAIVGGGIAGLTLGLLLHERGMPFRIYERMPTLRPLGVGINVLPHATRVLDRLGLMTALAARGLLTKEAAFANRFGQLFYREPVGLDAGYSTPQLSVHRGDLQDVLVEALGARAGADCIVTDAACSGFEQAGEAVILRFEARPPVTAAMAIACDGIHSVIRRQMHAGEGDPKYSGYNMWRGTTRMKPFLTGATMLRAGWLAKGKLVAYPIRKPDGEGKQLVNWLAELECPIRKEVRDWNRPGRVEDFLPAYADWHFDWLGAPALFRKADLILDFPMVDQDPLPFWSSGSVTLMGDAAHPMYPRGSNGAGQAILDAECLADLLAGAPDAAALKAYEAERLDATSRVVLANRVAPPDIILKEVVDRTGDRPFDNIEDVIPRAELAAMLQRYKEVAGYDLARLKAMAGAE